MILLAEKNQIRKNIGFDLSDPDQKLAYDILEMKRGKSLSRFLAKSIIIGEMIERKMQTEQKESTNEVVEEVINPVTPEPEEVKIPEPVKKVEESSGEDVDVEDKDSTEPILDKDTLAKAMNFMAGM